MPNNHVKLADLKGHETQNSSPYGQDLCCILSKFLRLDI